MGEPTPLEWLRDIAANGYIMSVSLRDGGHGDLMPKDITAGIEEAVAAERERIRAAVEGLPDASFGFYGEKYVPGHISRAAVLAAIEKRREETDADD